MLLHHALVISCIIAVGGQLLLLWSASRAASAPGNSTAKIQLEATDMPLNKQQTPTDEKLSRSVI
jgi:hypothetical protein